MAAKKSVKRKTNKNFAVVNGKKLRFHCKCRIKTLDCVTPEMWDEESRSLYKRK